MTPTLGQITTLPPAPSSTALPAPGVDTAGATADAWAAGVVARGRGRLQPGQRRPRAAPVPGAAGGGRQDRARAAAAAARGAGRPAADGAADKGAEADRADGAAEVSSAEGTGGGKDAGTTAGKGAGKGAGKDGGPAEGTDGGSADPKDRAVGPAAPTGPAAQPAGSGASSAKAFPELEGLGLSDPGASET